jgi:hypothetical protein
MKIKIQYVLCVLPLLAACASQPIVLAPVGPNPFASSLASTGTGYLRVFSEPEAVSEGFDEGANPTYYQHSDYNIYDAQGKLVAHVGNTIGHYEAAPRVVTLPPGNYTVKARARDYLVVKVPVAIKSQQITNVHLDGRWQPAPGTAKKELVTEPSGVPVGWRAASNSSRPGSIGIGTSPSSGG